MAEKIEGNPAFTLSVNVAGLKPLSAVSEFVRLPTGPYEVLCRDVVLADTKSGGAGKNLRFKMEVTEECEQKGETVEVVLFYDSEKEFSRRHLKNALLNVAKDPANLEKGQLTIKADLFLQKKMHIYVTQPPEGAKTEDGKTPFDQKRIIDPEQYKTLKAEGKKHAGAAATGAQLAVKQANGTSAAAEESVI